MPPLPEPLAEPLAMLRAAVLPGDWQVTGAVVQTLSGSPALRLQLQLQRPSQPDVLVLDARSDAAAPQGPFVAPPWSLTYRTTPIPFGQFAAAGTALLQHLARLGPLDGWPTDALVPGDGPQTGKNPAPQRQPQHSWFVRESALAAPLYRMDAAKRKTWLADQLATHGPPSAAIHLQLYLEGRCQQRCQFCTVPLERDRPQDGPQPPQARLVADGVLAALLDLLASRPGSLLTLLGDDWAAHPEREAWLALLQRDHGVRIGLLGPGTALADPALRAAVANVAQLDHVTLTLQARPDTEAGRACHDAVVGQVGAAALLDAAIGPLQSLGVPLAIASVVVRQSVPQLPGLLAYCAERGLQVALSGFVPDRCDLPAWQPAQHMARADEVLQALHTAGPLATQVLTRLAGLPLCAMPTSLHSRAARQWPSTDTEPWQPGDFGPCDRCARKGACPRVPASYAAAFAAQGLVPFAL